MAKSNETIPEYGEWCYCPSNPEVMRRIIGFDSDGMPIIEEKNIETFRKEQQDLSFFEEKSC